MTRSNVTQRLDLAVHSAAKRNGDLAKRCISPHTIRHTTAMHLQSEWTSVIALWMGHESPTTTHMYVEADLAMKERALAKLPQPDPKVRRYRAPDSLLQFLKTL
jgi:integrase